MEKTFCEVFVVATLKEDLLSKDIGSGLRDGVFHGWGYSKGVFWPRGTEVYVTRWNSQVEGDSWGVFGKDRKVVIMSKEATLKYLTSKKFRGKPLACNATGKDLYDRYQWELSR